MAKIGTAHIEIKPVINEEALEALVQRIEDAVAAGVARGMSGTSLPPVVNIYSPAEVIDATHEYARRLKFTTD